MDSKVFSPDEKTGWLFLTGFRWIALGIVIVLLVSDIRLSGSERTIELCLLIAGAYTLILSIGWNFLPHLFTKHFWLILVDVLVSFALLYFSGGWKSPFFIYSISPVLVAAFMRGGWRGAVIGLASLAGYFLAVVLNGASLFQLFQKEGTDQISMAAAYLVTAVFFSYPSGFLRQLRERNQQLALAQESLAKTNMDLNSVNRQLVALQSINAVLQSFLDLPRVIESVLDGIKYGLDFDRVAIGLVDEGEQKIAFWRAVGGYTPDEAGWASLELALDDESSTKAMLDSQVPIFVSELSDQTLDAKLTACMNTDSFVVMPMAVRAKPIGLIVVDNACGGRPIGDEDLSWLKVLATQAAIAINNAQLYQKAQELAALTERNRIAMEIHDGLSQTLSGARLILNSCGKMLPANLDPVRGKLAYLEKMLGRSYEEMRYAIFNLRLPFLTFDNLTTFFRQFIREFSEFSGIKSNFIVRGCEEVAELSEEAKLCLCRVLQESLSNARKHSGATILTVFCNFQANRVILKIVDNGRGFQPESAVEQAKTGKTFGVLTAENRVGLLGGALNIDSKPNRGTTVKVSMPYSSKEARPTTGIAGQT